MPQPKKMESLDPEDAEILNKLKEDLKEMRRSNSRASQKTGQDMKPSEKLTIMQSRMKKLRDTSQDLKESSLKSSINQAKEQTVKP